MKIDLGKVSYEGKWFDFGEARLKIRPYPASRTDVAFKDGAMIFSGEAANDMFDYCLEAWETVSDIDGKAIKMTRAVKKQVYDFRLGKTTMADGTEEVMSDFVLKTARALMVEIEADVGN
jgi:hypothetical protein